MGPTQWQASHVHVVPTNQLAEGDQYTCVEFNSTGELLAVGDRGGRITVFKLNPENGSFDIYCAFTSHEPEFDYLKSLEIEEKINSITWLGKMTSAHHLLSANDKTVKLWRLSERHHEAYNFNTRDDEGGAMWFHPEDQSDDTYGPPVPRLHSPQIRVPQFRKSQHLIVEARPRRVFSNAHTYHINAVSLNSDQETFLSADDLRINLWNLDVSNQSFTIVDLKPSNMEDLSEVVTCARFHPSLCYLLAYSTSKGVIRLCDMRARALCDNHVLVFEDPRLSHNFGFFADIIASLSDFRFSHSGQYVLARDYLTLKVWDIRMGDCPCEVYPVHEPFRCQLCMLYENDAIFDKFTCSWSHDDSFLITGSYGSLFRIFDRHGGSESLYSISSPQPGPMSTYPTNPDGNVSDSSLSTGGIQLSPQRFVSPSDPIGSCLGLTTVCFAPSKLVDELLHEHSNVSPNSCHSRHSTRSTSSHSDSSSSSTSSTDDGESGKNIDQKHTSMADGDTDAIADVKSHISCTTASSVDQQLSKPSSGGDKHHQRKRSHHVTGSTDPTATTADNTRVEVNGYPMSVNGDSYSSSAIAGVPQVTIDNDTKLTSSTGEVSDSALVGASNANPSDSSALVVDVLQLRRRIARMQALHGVHGEAAASMQQLGAEGIDAAAGDVLSLPGVRQLDCQCKLLHMTWHPNQLLAAAISGNQLVVINNSLSSKSAVLARGLPSGAPLTRVTRFTLDPVKNPPGSETQVDQQQQVKEEEQKERYEEEQDGDNEGGSTDDDDDEEEEDDTATEVLTSNGHELSTISCGKHQFSDLRQQKSSVRISVSRSPLMKIGRKRRRRQVPNGDNSLTADSSGCSLPKKDALASCSSDIPPFVFVDNATENESHQVETSMDYSIHCDRCDVSVENVVLVPQAALLNESTASPLPDTDSGSLSSATLVLTPSCTETRSV